MMRFQGSRGGGETGGGEEGEASGSRSEEVVQRGGGRIQGQQDLTGQAGALGQAGEAREAGPARQAGEVGQVVRGATHPVMASFGPGESPGPLACAPIDPSI